MIRIVVELHPHGLSTKKRVIGRMEIWNDGSGDRKRGNYRFRWHNGDLTDKRSRIHTGFVRNFARLSRNVFDLLRLCLNAEERPIHCEVGHQIDFADGKCHHTHLLSRDEADALPKQEAK